MHLNRRAVLGGLGGLMVGGAVAGLVGNVASAAESKDAVKKPTSADTQRFAQVGGDVGYQNAFHIHP